MREHERKWPSWRGHSAMSLGVAVLGIGSAVGCDAALGGAPENGPGVRSDGGAPANGDGDEDGVGDGDGEPDSKVVLDDDHPGGLKLSCDLEADLAETPLLKLSTQQYRNTVLDVLERYGLDELKSTVGAALQSIPDDSLGDSFRGLDDRIELNHVQGYFQVGVALGNALRENPDLLGRLAGSCGREDFDRDCWDDFVSGFVSTLSRRPLSSSEKKSLDELFDEASDPVEAVRGAIIVTMSSPRFVYHVEVDGEEIEGRDDLLDLDAYEIASRLSYTFWQTMPDEELFALAEDGSLLEKDVYEEQLTRVWEDERTQETIFQFWKEWLRLEKFTGFETSRPGFRSLAGGFDFESHDYYSDMVDEVHDLTFHFTFDEPGTLTDLLSTNLSLTRSAELAELYGVEPWDGSGEFPRFDADERAGLLQRAALLVSNLEQTNPFHRGALVRRSILCDNLLQPDPNQLPAGALDPPPVDEAQTTRERFAAKVDGNALCERCHKGFSAIGYVLESYDALGRYRTVEQVFDEKTGDLLAELPIDTTGEVSIVSSDESPVENATEMNERIAQSGKVQACLAKSYLRFFARRAYQGSSLDACVVKDLSETLEAQDGGLAAAFSRMARVSTFFTKKVGKQ